MNKTELRNLFAAAFAHRIKCVLDAVRIKGWTFPPYVDVGVTITSDSPMVTRLVVRMDDVTQDVRVRTPRETLRADILDAAEDIVAAWLAKHATGRAVPPRMRCLR